MVRIVVSVYRSDLVKLLGLKTCGVRLTRAFRSGTVRRRRCRRECGLEVTVREQRGRRMKRENGEGEMERDDMRTANTLSHASTRCLYVTQRNCQKNVRAKRSVCTPPSVAHTVVATTWVRNPELKKKQKPSVFYHSMSILISPTRTCSTSLLSTKCQMYELMLLGFPRHALLLILDDAFVWNLNLRFGSPRSTSSNCVRAI